MRKCTTSTYVKTPSHLALRCTYRVLWSLTRGLAQAFGGTPEQHHDLSHIPPPDQHVSMDVTHQHQVLPPHLQQLGHHAHELGHVDGMQPPLPVGSLAPLPNHS